MRTQTVAFFMAIGIAALVTPMVLRFANLLGLYDPPDGERKIHDAPIPRLGGIAIAAGFVVPLIGLLFYTNALSNELKLEEGRLFAFFGGFLAILLLGLYDDIKGVGAWGKLAVQLGVGTMLWMGGLRFDTLQVMGEIYQFGLLSLPLTLMWVAAIINALNLIDGLDGLAGGVSFFASVSLFVIAWMDGNQILALFGTCLAGASLGFLMYNFEPALIFMGDCGSMTIGYVFAASSLWGWGKRTTVMALMLPVIALGLPIFDTLFAFMRRALTGRSPFSSDRGHIHHRLMDAGFSHRQSVLVLYALCLLLTTLVAVVRTTEDPAWGAVVAGLVVFIFISGRAMMYRSRRAMRHQQGAAEPGGQPTNAPATEQLNAAPAEEAAANGQAQREETAEAETDEGGVVVPFRRAQ